MASFYSFKTIIMRNHLLSLLVALLAVTGSLPVVAQEAYAVLTSDETLTFYYDNQRAIHRDYGRIYDMPELWKAPAWAGDYDKHQENIKHVVFDVSFSEYHPTSTYSWFAYCINLQDIKGIRNLNTQNVTNMDRMFYDCEELTSLDVSNFNTQNVTDISCMFSGCKALTSLDVSNFNTQNVTYMDYMFYNCSALTSLDVSNFNTKKVFSMSWMFYNCESLTSIFCNKDWNVGHNVSDDNMFYGCRHLKGTNTWFNANKRALRWLTPPRVTSQARPLVLTT